MAEKEPSVVRIALNVPALERLLGGDSELEVHLRHQVAENFCRRHLKSLLKSEAIQDVIKSFQADAIEEVQQNIGTLRQETYGAHRKLTLKPEFEEKLKALVQVNVDQIIASAMPAERLKDLIKQQTDYWSGYIDRSIRRHIDVEIEKQVTAGIAARLAAASAAANKETT